jgi:hypothetical protein
MVHGQMVRREMKYGKLVRGETVRGETIIRGNVPNPKIYMISMYFFSNSGGLKIKKNQFSSKTIGVENYLKNE